MNKKNIYFNKAAVVGFVKNLLIIMRKKLENCHVTLDGAAHWICNINIQLAKKFPIIFHNLRGYNSHLIFCELHKFDLTISVVPNEVEKNVAFFLNKT